MASIHCHDDGNASDETPTNTELTAYDTELAAYDSNDEDFTDPNDQAKYEEYLANYVDEEIADVLSPLRECNMANMQVHSRDHHGVIDDHSETHTPRMATTTSTMTPASRPVNRSRCASWATSTTLLWKTVCSATDLYGDVHVLA